MKRSTGNMIRNAILGGGAVLGAAAYYKDWGPFAEPSAEEQAAEAETAHTTKVEATRTAEVTRVQKLQDDVRTRILEARAKKGEASSGTGAGDDTEAVSDKVEKITGEGTITLSDGTIVQGHFVDGVPDPYFDLTLTQDGTVIELKAYGERQKKDGWYVWTDQANKKFDRYTWNKGTSSFDVQNLVSTAE